MNILGPSSVSVEAAQAWARSKNAHQRAVDVARLYWQIAPRYGIPPEIAFAQAMHETDWGKYTGVVPSTYHNWCGLKTKQGGSNTSASAHQAFPSDDVGVLAHIQHLARYAGAETVADSDFLVDPRWSLVTKTTQTVEGLGGAWAPAKSYGTTVAALVTDLRSFANDGSWPVPADKPTVALAAGHHNTSGGNADEKAQTGRLTPAIAAALRARGVNVRVITPDEGRGDFPGTLSDVARQVKATDTVFLEVHTEGVSNPNVRGIFAIYPDWDGDVDTDVRDTLGPSIVNAVSDATGLPVRGNGLMSEKKTGVGIGGDRLGIFRVTEPLKASVTRLIVEYGAHTNAADMALWNAPGFVERAAGATADAIAAFLGVAVPQPDPPPPADDRILVDGNPFGPFGYALGFKGRLQQIGNAVSPSDPNAGILAWAGFPKEDEWQGTDGCTYQRTERLILKYEPGVTPPFDIVARLRSTDALPDRKKP